MTKPTKDSRPTSDFKIRVGNENYLVQLAKVRAIVVHSVVEVKEDEENPYYYFIGDLFLKDSKPFYNIKMYY